MLMKKRFQQEKIYVLGLSWGTILGTKLVQQYPDNYYAYIGTGQMVNTAENDQMGYRFALELMENNGNQRLMKKLASYGEPPYTGDGLALKYAAYNNVLFEYMGSAKLQTVLLLVPQFSREYGLIDKFNFARGLAQSFAVVYPQLQGLDFTTQASELDVPMYFMVGKKELIWLESGYGASSADILDTMVNHVMVNSPPDIAS